jgi:hypothetical protein
VIAHVMGLPLEESVLQLAPAGAAVVSAVAIAGRASLDRLRRRRPGRAQADEAPDHPSNAERRRDTG